MNNDLVTTIQVILSIFGGITCIGGGISFILKLLSPYKQLKLKVEEHENKLQNDYQKFEELNTAMNGIEKSNRVICKSLMVLMNHEITGNSIDKLKEQKDALEEYLIDK